MRQIQAKIFENIRSSFVALCRKFLRTFRSPILFFHSFLLKSLYFKSSRSANLNVNYLKVREKEVVFISKKAGWRELKLAHGLRSSNWGVKLVSMEEPHFKAYDDFTEVIICKSLRSFSDTLLSLKSMIYHNFVINSEISSHLIQHKLPGKLVVDLTDYAFSFGPENFPIEKRYNFDIKVQSYLLSIADGICARDAQLLFERKITNVGKEKELILFPEYCWGAEARERFFEGDNQFFEGSKKGGIAQIGWFGAEIRGETDQGIFSVVESLVGSGQEMHIFTHPRQPQPGSIKFKAFYPNHIELMEKSRKINFYNSVRYDELFKKLQPYCWGLNIINFPVFEKESATISSRRLALCGSARNFDYLDAGLGLILCEDAKYMYRSFNQYGVAVDIRNAIRNKSLKKVLSEPIPRHRILMASEKLKIKNNISRLIAFYKKLM